MYRLPCVTPRARSSLHGQAPDALRPSSLGRIAKVVLDCHERALISDDSVAFYLACSVDYIRESRPAAVEV